MRVCVYSVIYLEAGDFKVDEDAVQVLLLFDLRPVVLLARAEVLARRQPQLEVYPALDGGSLRAAAQLVPALDARRRDLLRARAAPKTSHARHVFIQIF